jgi:5-methylcytosine-specific restriction endonuclease McrA
MPRKKSKIKLLKEECEKLMNEVAEILWEKECVVCGSRKDVVIHHFIPRRLARHLIYNPTNWVLLCSKCHFDLHKRENHMIAVEIYKRGGEEWYSELLSFYEKKPEKMSFLKFLEKEKAKLEGWKRYLKKNT